MGLGLNDVKNETKIPHFSRLRRFPIESPPLGEFILNFDVFNTKLMIFRDNNGFETCLVLGAINYYDKLSTIGSSANVLVLSFCRSLVLVPMFYFPIFDGTNHLL